MTPNSVEPGSWDHGYEVGKASAYEEKQDATVEWHKGFNAGWEACRKLIRQRYELMLTMGPLAEDWDGREPSVNADSAGTMPDRHCGFVWDQGAHRDGFAHVCDENLGHTSPHRCKCGEKDGAKFVGAFPRTAEDAARSTVDLTAMSEPGSADDELTPEQQSREDGLYGRVVDTTADDDADVCRGCDKPLSEHPPGPPCPPWKGSLADAVRAKMAHDDAAVAPEGHRYPDACLLCGELEPHGHRWDGEKDTRYSNHNYGGPSDCCCGGGLAFVEGFEHTPSRCGPSSDSAGSEDDGSGAQTPREARIFLDGLREGQADVYRTHLLDIETTLGHAVTLLERFRDDFTATERGVFDGIRMEWDRVHNRLAAHVKASTLTEAPQ